MRRVCVVIGLVMLTGCESEGYKEWRREEAAMVDACVNLVGISKNSDPKNGRVVDSSVYPDEMTVSYDDYEGRTHMCVIRNRLRHEGRQPTISVKNF